MDASALDEILDWMDADGYGVPIGTHERKDEAREELAALRARVEDLEMIAAELSRGEFTELFQAPTEANAGQWALCRSRALGTLYLEADPRTGLPLLTAEARRALRGET